MKRHDQSFYAYATLFALLNLTTLISACGKTSPRSDSMPSFDQATVASVPPSTIEQNPIVGASSVNAHQPLPEVLGNGTGDTNSTSVIPKSASPQLRSPSQLDPNQLLYATLQQENWFWRLPTAEGPGPEAAASGTVLVLSSDPNACILAAAQLVSSGTFAVKIADPNFSAALVDAGGTFGANNTYVFIWDRDLLDSNQCFPGCANGTSVGMSQYAITEQSGQLWVEVALTGLSVPGTVRLPVSSCSAPLPAPPLSSYAGPNQLCPPVRCAN